jgi:hypothetical protein
MPTLLVLSPGPYTMVRLIITVLVPVFTGLLGYFFAKQQLLRKTSSDKSDVRIILADYRAIDGEGHIHDVTECLRQMIAGDSLVLDIQNHNFRAGDRNFVPNDPKPGMAKRLRVTYSWKGGAAVAIERPEGARLVLPEDSFLKTEQQRLEESFQEEIMRRETAHQAELWRAQEGYRQCEAEKREAVAKLGLGTFAPLQLDAVRLAGSPSSGLPWLWSVPLW